MIKTAVGFRSRFPGLKPLSGLKAADRVLNPDSGFSPVGG
jgi:hypothetical protein